MEKKKILIIDDEEIFAKMTKLFLEGTGDYEVEYQTDSKLAVESARAIKPDLILLDIVMPDLDGGDVQALLRQDPILSSIPVMFVTSMVSQSDVSEGALVQSGENLMLPKTSDPTMVRKAIEDKLAGQI